MLAFTIFCYNLIPITLCFITKDTGQQVPLVDLVVGSIPHENSSESFNLENVGRSWDFPSIQLGILHATTVFFVIKMS